MSKDLIIQSLTDITKKITDTETYLQNLQAEFHAVRGKVIAYKEMMADIQKTLIDLDESTDEPKKKYQKMTRNK